MSASGKTYEVSLELQSDENGESDLCRLAIESLGISSENITELFKNNKHSLSVYFKRSDKVHALRRQIKALGLRKVKIRTKTLIDQEWKTKWKEEFKPFWITRETYIIPSWLKGKIPERKKRNVYIDSTVAFGTGLHATTQFMAEYIESKSHALNRFLDLGTGTGILSIIAIKCGAKYVTALDFSSQAIVTAKYNFQTNKVKPDQVVCADVGKWTQKKKYDFVAANLITDELLNNQKRIVQYVQKAGYLAVSGISLNNYPRFRREFNETQLRCLRIRKGEGWAAILYKKIPKNK